MTFNIPERHQPFAICFPSSCSYDGLGLGLQLYWKWDSGTGVFLWILWNTFLYRTFFPFFKKLFNLQLDFSKVSHEWMNEWMNILVKRGTHLTFNAARVLKINVLTFCLHKVLPKCRVSIRKSSIWFYINSSVQ